MTARNWETHTSNPYSLSNHLVDLIRRGAASTRNELAERTGVGRSLIAQRVAELIEMGIIHEDGPGPSRGGRSPRALRFNAEGALVIGAEVGATSIDVAVTELSGRELDMVSLPWNTWLGPEATLGKLVEMIRGVISALPPDHAMLLGVGVGLPGPVDFDAGAMVAPPGLPDWNGFPFASRLNADLGLEVWVDNDVNMMAIGERALGHAKEHDDFIVVKVGSGLGVGIVIDGELHRGVDGGAGEIGHVPFGESTLVCHCGRVGCLSAIAGGLGIARVANARADEGANGLTDIREGLARPLTAEDVSRAAATGDIDAFQILTRAGSELGRAIAIIVGFANTTLVVLAGGVSLSGDVLLSAVRTAAYDRAPALGGRNLQIRTSTLGARAGAVGAALMCVDELLTPERLERFARDRHAREHA